ncbi:MAG: hypothetical protein ACREP6_10465 [Candidatus Binataceae bacterium]
MDAMSGAQIRAVSLGVCRFGGYLRLMSRLLAGAVIIAIIAAGIGYEWSVRQQAAFNRQQQQISDLQKQLSRVQNENSQLHSNLKKVQDEEGRLAAENNILNEAIAKARLTGKVPNKIPLPYPPK